MDAASDARIGRPFERQLRLQRIQVRRRRLAPALCVTIHVRLFGKNQAPLLSSRRIMELRRRGSDFGTFRNRFSLHSQDCHVNKVENEFVFDS
jgi:hypothetical protein